MSADLIALAERVEKAEGPSFRLEQEVWAAAVAEPPANLACLGHIKPPAYTASLDAAMTLVPEGLQFGCGTLDSTGKAWAWTGEGKALDEPYKSMFTANAATPALALTAAALLAIATEARRAETSGSVEDEGAAPTGIAR